MAETLRELVVTLSLDPSNFSRNIRTINQQIKEAESSFRLAGAGIQNYEKTVDGLQSKLNMMSQKQFQLKTAVDQYSRALVAANDKFRENYNRQVDYSQRLAELKQLQGELCLAVQQATYTYEDYCLSLGETDSATIAVKQNLDQCQKEYEEATAEVTKLEGQVTALQKTMQNSADAVSKARTNLNNAQASLKETEAEIDKLVEQLYRMRSAWTQAGEALTAISNKCNALSKTMTKAGKTLTTYVTSPLIALGTSAIKASIDYEYAFADVRKTVDATEEEYEQLSQSIKQMSTEVASSAEDIAEVMSIAGQLGIENEHLAEFTRTMIDLGNSTNMAAADAANEAARFANIMGMSQDQFQNLGSTLVDLGNNYATTESEIMAMSLRLAGAGKQVGLSESQILGFAAALSSVGIEAQMGGSAFSKALIKMEVAAATGGDALDDFAKVSGMTASEFKALWEQDAAAAFQAFIVGLSKMDEQGVSAIKTLDDIGIAEIRLRDTLLRATNATELFSKTQATANAAWEKNLALSTEANKRYATTKSRLSNLKNTALMFARQIGDDLNPTIQKIIDKANELLQKFLSMDQSQRESIVKWAAFAAAIGPVILVLGKVLGAVGTVTGALGKAFTAMGKFSASISVAGGGLNGFLTALASTKLAMVALGAAVIYGAVKLADYASGAKAAREALEGMAKTARSWKETAAETFYNKSQGLSFFGMSSEDFTRDGQKTVSAAQKWLDDLLSVWSDGKKESDTDIEQWINSFKSLNKDARVILKQMKEDADKEGLSFISAHLQADIDTMDAMDQEIAALLKKRQNRPFTEEEKIRLQDLIDARQVIEIKYRLTPAETEGFESVRNKLEVESARAAARGQEVAVNVYENALVAAAQGLSAVNSSIDAEYEKEYNLIKQLRNATEQQQALDALNKRYNNDRRAAALEYARLMSEVVMPVWEQEDIQEAKTQIGDLMQLLRQYSTLTTEEEKKSFLPDLDKLTASMDEGAVAEYIGLLTQIQSLLDTGMSESEIKALFPEIDFSSSLEQLAAIQTFLNDNKWDNNLSSLTEMFGDAIGEEVLKIATDLDMTGAMSRWEEWADHPGAITTDAIVQSYADAENATVAQPIVDAFIAKYTEIPAGADTASLTPTGLLAYVQTYAEVTSGADVSGLNPTNITAMVSAYKELASGTDISQLTPDEITAYVIKYLESNNVDTTGLTPEAVTAFVMAYTEITGGASTSALTPSSIIALVTKYAEAQNLDMSGLNPTNVIAMVNAYRELASGADISQLTPDEITAYVIKYLEDNNVDISGLTPESITAFVNAYRELAGGASIAALTPSNIIALVNLYAEDKNIDVSGLNPTNITAMVSAYRELASGTDISMLNPSDITAYVLKYLEDKNIDTTGLTPDAITAFVVTYQEAGGGASTTALKPSDIVAIITRYAEAENLDLSALTSPQIVAIVDKFAEATGCDKTELLREFVAYITEYREAAGVKKPTLNIQVGLSGYDLLAYRRWLKNNTVEVEGIVRLSEVYEDPTSVLGESGVRYWKDGQEIPVTAVTTDMLRPEDVVVLDKDGTMHVLITTEVTGAPEAIAKMREQVAEVDQLGVTAFGSARTGILPSSLMKYISAAEKRIKTAKGDLNKWYSFVLGGNENILETLDQSIQSDFNAERIAQLSTYVAEVVKAIQTGEAVGQEDIDNLNTILQFIQDLDSVGVGGNVSAGIAEGMTEAGWDTAADTVATNLQEAINSALIIESPSQLMKPTGENVAAGIGEGMNEYSFSSNASLLADNMKNAILTALKAVSLKSIGINAMDGLKAGILAGRAGVINAMQLVARDAVNIVKRELKIASPSKVFRDEIGTMAMKGFGEGILQESRIQAKTIQNAIRYMTGEAAVSATVPANTRSYTQNYDDSVSLNIGEMIMRGDVDVMALAQQISSMGKRSRRARGSR